MMPDMLAASPVIGEGCFDAPERSYLIRTEVPVTAEILVAAIYGEREDLFDFDIADDGDLWEAIAFALAMEGFRRIEDRALSIRAEQRSGTLAAPEWLALCRRRVADLISPGWQAARHRCPCGYATNDAPAFDEHLRLAEAAEPEHFEITESGPIHCFWERDPLLPRTASLDRCLRLREHGRVTLVPSGSCLGPG
jgi:hypothetical protein